MPYAARYYPRRDLPMCVWKHGLQSLGVSRYVSCARAVLGAWETLLGVSRETRLFNVRFSSNARYRDLQYRSIRQRLLP